MEHLNSQQIYAFHERSLASPERLEISRHIDTCQTCRLALLEGKTQSTPRPTLTCTLVEPEDTPEQHLEYEEKIGLLEGTLAPTLRTIVKDHLEVCPTCRMEIDELRSFRAVLNAQPATPILPAELFSSWKDWKDWKERLLSYLKRPALRIGLQLAAVTFVGATLMFLFDPSRTVSFKSWAHDDSFISSSSVSGQEFVPYSNTSGYNNVANGAGALQLNTTGSYNTNYGTSALQSTTTGGYNTATGSGALYFNTTGTFNTATGGGALFSNTTGSNNTANGYEALSSNTIGYGNVTNGLQVPYSNTNGDNPPRVGAAPDQNTMGLNNIVLGSAADYNITTRRNSIDIGNYVGLSGDSSMTMGIPYKKLADQGEHHKQYGLIPEEVARVYPDLVQYDQERKSFTVYYHLLAPMLLNEAQRAHKQIEEQKTEIAKLKAKLVHQETELTALKQALAQMRKMTTTQRR